MIIHYCAGHCKCGSYLKCTILPYDETDKLIKISCAASEGDGNCGKRQCRGDTRKKIVDALDNESTELFRTKKAAEMMIEGDRADPPHLYHADVLRTAKYQASQKMYRDPNPIIGLSKLKRSAEGIILLYSKRSAIKLMCRAEIEL